MTTVANDLFSQIQDTQDQILQIPEGLCIERSAMILTEGTQGLRTLAAYLTAHGATEAVQPYLQSASAQVIFNLGNLTDTTWRPDQVAVEANIVKTAFATLVALIKRVIAFIANTWTRFSGVIVKKKELLTAVYKSLSSSTINDAKVKAITVTAPKPRDLQLFGEAAERMAELFTKVSDDTSFDKMLANSVSDHSMDADLALLGLQPKVNTTTGSVPQFSFEAIPGKVFPETLTDTLGNLGWSITEIQAITAHAMKLCDQHNALERSYRVFVSKLGNWERQATDAMNAHTPGSSADDKVADLAAYVHNLQGIMKVLLYSLNRYTDLVYRISFLVNQNAK